MLDKTSVKNVCVDTQGIGQIKQVSSCCSGQAMDSITDVSALLNWSIPWPINWVRYSQAAVMLGGFAAVRAKLVCVTSLCNGNTSCA